MIRRLVLWSLTLVCIHVTAVAQTAETGKLSTFVRHALKESQRQESVTRGNDSQTAQRRLLAFVKVHNGQSLLQKYSCQAYAQWGDLYIASIPLTSLAALSAEAQVERIEANASARQLLDTSVTVINALPIYEATPVHQAFTGNGVVMGLMDVGFDLTHPNFYDRQLTHSRISAIWDQLSPDTVGSTLPAGRDYIGEEAVLAHARSTDGEIMVHGTHTLGIATGTGYDTPYRGIAYDSDICLVSNIVEEDTAYFDYDPADKYLHTNALDALGFKYLFDYAERQGKPCVASFSEGYPPYFDEEESLFAAVLDSLSGPGRIIVASAGNEGLVKSYFEKRPETTEDGVFIRCYSNETAYRIKGSGPFKLHLYHYGTEPGVPTHAHTTDLSTLPYESEVTDTFVINSDTLTVALYRKASVYQPDDVWYVTLHGSRTLHHFSPLALTIEGDDYAETFGDSSSDLHTRDIDPRWQAAQDGHNILAPGCFNSVICVGASTHRMGGNTLNGSYNVHAGTVQGRVSPYSSTGPTVDGRTKPDVVAPGTNIISSFSHFLPPTRKLMKESDFNGTVYPWGVETGTSMSAPMVAGTIALWLQARPTLTSEEVLQVFRRTCQHPDPEINYPNTLYGYGEIDAYRGLLDILGVDRIEGLSLQQPSALHVWPSGNGLRLTTDAPISETIKLKLYSLSGVCTYETSVHINGTEAYLPLPPHAAGVYVVQINASTKELQGSQLVRLIGG